MGHLSNARKCPPIPWECKLKEENGDYLYIFDAEGNRIGALWGPVARIYPAARLLEALTRLVDPEQVADLARPVGVRALDENPAERDERSRLRGIRMRKARMMSNAAQGTR